MSKVSLTNTLPCTLIAVLGNEKDPESKEIQFMEPFNFNISWTMYASSYNNDDITLEELSIKQNIAYQKIEHLLRNYINNAIWYDDSAIQVIDCHFPSSQNVLFITPASNVMYVANCLFAKFNAICGKHITVCKLELTDVSTGLSYNIEDDTGSIPDILPDQKDFMGELSVYELPWWERTDVSTYDNKCLSEEEQTKVRSTLDESKELLEEDFKQIESDVRSYMTTKPDEAEIIDLDSQRIKNKKWKPKIVK